MFDETMDFIVGLLILSLFGIVATVLISAYIKPAFITMYYQVPYHGINYSTYSSIANRLGDLMKIIMAIIIGGVFLYFILRLLFKEEVVVYEEY